MLPIDLTGQRFGRLTVLLRLPSRKGHVWWRCRCDCGNEIDIAGLRLRHNVTKSCGCWKLEMLEKRSLKHGQSRRTGFSRTYQAWAHAKQRCFNPGDKGFQRYGGRGITMCERWRNSFEAFFADMGPCPEGLTLERIDVNGHYEPANCKWATLEEQNSNQRRIQLIEWHGRKICLAELAREEQVDYFLLVRHFRRLGKSLQEAIDHVRSVQGKGRWQ